MLSPFHLAIPVHDLDEARRFYGELFGCREGRSAETWVDFDFFGHQLVCHLDPQCRGKALPRNEVDRDQVPVPHFGIVLELSGWENLAGRLRAAGTEFIIDPRIRFRGQAGEQATMFLADASGNVLEFKAFADPSQLFAREAPTV